MTLTIAAVNYRVAFLSSDFRLTATAAPSACLPASPKLLQVSHRQLDALVAYCGLGSIGKIQTNDWLAEQFRSSTGDSLASTLEQVRTNAASFISHAPSNQRALTIVLCGVTAGRIFLASISNHERMDGTRESARGSFSLEARVPKADVGLRSRRLVPHRELEESRWPKQRAPLQGCFPRQGPSPACDRDLGRHDQTGRRVARFRRTGQPSMSRGLQACRSNRCDARFWQRERRTQSTLRLGQPRPC